MRVQSCVCPECWNNFTNCSPAFPKRDNRSLLLINNFFLWPWCRNTSKISRGKIYYFFSPNFPLAWTLYLTYMCNLRLTAKLPEAYTHWLFLVLRERGEDRERESDSSGGKRASNFYRVERIVPSDNSSRTTSRRRTYKSGERRFREVSLSLRGGEQKAGHPRWIRAHERRELTLVRAAQRRRNDSTIASATSKQERRRRCRESSHYRGQTKRSPLLSLALSPSAAAKRNSFLSRLAVAPPQTRTMQDARRHLSCLSSSRKFRYASSCAPGNFPPRVRHALLLSVECRAYLQTPKELVKAEDRN